MTSIAQLQPNSSFQLPRSAGAIIAVTLLTIGADQLFWKIPVGASLGVFACIAAGLLIAIQPAQSWSHKRWIALAMLAVSVIQSAIEISFSNVLAMLALLMWLLGDFCFSHFPEGWARWIEAQCSLLAAPLRWAAMWTAMENGKWGTKVDKEQVRSTLWKGIQIVAPAALVAGVFLCLLLSGNPMLAKVVERLSEWFADWFQALDLSIGRMAFWCAVSGVSLAWFSPLRRGWVRWAWGSSWPQWNRHCEAIGRWQSILMLASLNAIFFAANTLDVIYLWARAALPNGASHSAYLHAGVGSLIVAALLSGAVLAVIFQQQMAITGNRLLRVLAYVWIGQNVLLIAGVVLRLKLYIEAYQWTELRVYVAFFLLLVATGFGTLAWRIARGRTLGWLVLANLRTTFALFFGVQFLNVSGWIADANVARWSRDPSHPIDVDYLVALGAPAFPALERVAQLRPETAPGLQAKAFLAAKGAAERERLSAIDWRSAQLRRDANARQLIKRLRDRLPMVN